MATGPTNQRSYTAADEVKENLFHLQNTKDLDPLLDRIGDARFVLLGEATHGTHEYYVWRTEITRRLVEEKGFNFVAVEGDWPDCYRLNRYIKGYSDQDKKPIDMLRGFERWPTWMWANLEVAALITFLKDHNAQLYPDQRVGFYGLDVYSLWESMDTLVEYLEKTDPNAAALARKAAQCFEPYAEDGQLYATAQMEGLPQDGLPQEGLSQSCREDVVKLLREIRAKAPQYDHDPEAALNTEQNAHVAVNAERYYRSMVGFDDNSWNIRDTHMVETLNRIANFYGPGSKAIVWEHNTHIGDARYTDMKRAGMVNVGQLVRQQHHENEVVLVGFGSYQGTVIAGSRWGAPMEVMEVPEAREGSVEELLHNESAEDRLLIFDRYNPKERFSKVMPHRAIGVVYNPEYESYGNYVPTVLNARYDAFIFLDTTTALHPLRLQTDQELTPGTFPSGK
ncbi:erythromycin esterase family protein [Telluribacter sp.]|jgi:erythromycin esterase-like protein|uniref:erythromycin esterase family protein n=1 Tax=Telluribacter sp. TaxID=1978767 RepID=UPI002E13D92E|nr:erythromycin esterase family protein [Telluribacter sp.]